MFFGSGGNNYSPSSINMVKMGQCVWPFQELGETAMSNHTILFSNHQIILQPSMPLFWDSSFWCCFWLHSASAFNWRREVPCQCFLEGSNSYTAQVETNRKESRRENHLTQSRGSSFLWKCMVCWLPNSWGLYKHLSMWDMLCKECHPPDPRHCILHASHIWSNHHIQRSSPTSGFLLWVGTPGRCGWQNNMPRVYMWHRHLLVVSTGFNPSQENTIFKKCDHPIFRDITLNNH